MTVSFQHFPNERIIVANFDVPFSSQDVALANEETARVVLQRGSPVYRIENIVGPLSFDDVTEGLAVAARSSVAGSARDPNVIFLFVGKGPIVEMTAKSFSQTQYAGREVPLFGTLEEALAYARAKLHP